VGVVEEDLAIVAPYKADVLLISVVRGAGGVVVVEGVHVAEGVIEGRDLEGDDLMGSSPVYDM
jgi:hypothetical protein